MDNPLLNDIEELCVCCAEAIVVISQRYNVDPREISKTFISVYQKINSDFDKEGLHDKE